MAPKKLHMIGHSHIDPVWFWTREEGMQEVRATIRSALDRMDEFEDFRFTCTSAAFFSFLQEAHPAEIARIRARVQEGRFELAAGWWLEPDCNLPCGEAFVRQGLYGQRLLQSLFGQMAHICINIDSFGHNPMLPQLLVSCGMDAYVFMRPSLSRSDNPAFADTKAPLFRWQSPDGSTITALSLPAEYTSWFEESTRNNIETTLGQLGPYPSLPCFFGVGNHGGGPTIENIRTVRRFQDTYPEAALQFSTLSAFFADVKDLPLPTYSVYLEHINTGCYSIDHRYKQQMRQAEGALLRAERLLAMASLLGNPLAKTHKQALAPLWQRLLFNQFHDTLGGTAIEEARDNAMADLGGIAAQAAQLAQLAVQYISATVDTEGDGHPILLINDSAQPWHGIVDTELNWFCKDPLTLRDEAGQEIAYQRDKQSCTMMWYRLGGRRRVLFPCDLPPFGIRVLRAYAQTPTIDPTPAHDDGPPCLENEHLIARWDENGFLSSLVDKHTGYDALSGPARPQIWQDARDSWGGGEGMAYAPTGEAPTLDELRVTERGDMRQMLRTRHRFDGCTLTSVYILDRDARHLRHDLHLIWDRPWHQLKWLLPVAGGTSAVSEVPYSVMTRPANGKEAYMHRYVDLQGEAGQGLTVANDGIYAFSAQDGTLRLTLLRSSIFSQGSCVGWQNEHDTYDYTDMGDHRFSFLLSPHGGHRAPHEMAQMADQLMAAPVALQDCFHAGAHHGTSLLSVDTPAIRIGTAKFHEDSDSLILRLYETDGLATAATLRIGAQAFPLSFAPYQILTLRYDGQALTATNMLEMDTNE